MTKRSIAVALALLLAALAFPLAPSPVMANPGSQNWYLTDFTSAVSGADYIMYRASGNGTGDITITSGASMIWAADEAANIVLDMSGDWSVTLSAKGNKANATVHIGTLSGGSFTSKGSTTQVLTANLQSWGFTVTTTDHSIAAGDYLAAQISATGADAVIDVLGATNSDSYIISPTAAPDYPGTVTISFTVTDYGSDGINFGSLNMGDTDQPADQNPPTQGAVTLTVGSETNVNVNIQLKGLDFSGPDTLLLSSADVHYDDDNTLDEGTETLKPQGTLTTGYVTWYPVAAYTADAVECYHWISIPSGQMAGAYTSTFYYQAVQQ